MALEIFPPTATLGAGESQSFEARQAGSVVTGAEWSIAPGDKGKIDPATGVYTSPSPPIFVSKDVTIVARKSGTPPEFGSATIQVSCAHSWILLIAAYLTICAGLLSWWGSCVWPEAVPPDASQSQGPKAENPGVDLTDAAQPAPKTDTAPAKNTAGATATQPGADAKDAEGSRPPTAPAGESGSPDRSNLASGDQPAAKKAPGDASPTAGGAGQGQGDAPKPSKDRILALIQLILIFGAGGALVHAVRSLYSFVGNKQFEPNWAPFYFARPFEGAVLALLTIFMFEDSLIEALPGTITLKNVWTVCGVAGLVGLFTDKALRKLEQIFDAVLTPPTDTRGGKLTASAALAPVLAALTPEKATAGSDAIEVQIAGDRFDNSASAMVNGAARATVFQSAKSLSFTLTKADLSQAATLKITVKGKSATSNELDFKVES